MSAEDNKSVVRRLVDQGWNAHQLEVFESMLAPDFRNHDPYNPTVTDREAYKQYAAAVFAAFRDFHVQIQEMTAEDDRVAKRWTILATHTGPFGGIPATGKQVEFTGISIYHLAGGKVAELWWAYDMLGFLQQVGVVPAMEQPAQRG